MVVLQTISYWRDRLKNWGYDPLFLSVKQSSGLGALEETLEGQTTVVVGPSGVGKSSLINALRRNQNISEEDPIHQLVEQVTVIHLNPGMSASVSCNQRFS
jgi:ribosome biogenesis GTPase